MVIVIKVAIIATVAKQTLATETIKQPMKLNDLYNRQWKLLGAFTIEDLANPITRQSFDEARDNISKEIEKLHYEMSNI